MTSAGVMASGVNVAIACTSVLQDNFNALTNWTNPSGQFSIVAGSRNASQLRGTGDPNTGVARYTIPAGNQLDTITMGFAWQPGSITGGPSVLRLESDAGATSHIYCVAFADGSLNLRQTGTAGPILLKTATGVITANVWSYVEIKVRMHDTAGYILLQVDNGPLLSVSNIDTKFGGTKTVWDTVCLLTPGPSATSWFDDLYISTGTDCSFVGDHYIP